jgi:hypothetical protein
VYHLNEFITYKLHHETKKECGNLKIKLKKNYQTKLMSNSRIGCINRDINAVKKSLSKKNKLLT